MNAQEIKFVLKSIVFDKFGFRKWSRLSIHFNALSLLEIGHLNYQARSYQRGEEWALAEEVHQALHVLSKYADSYEKWSQQPCYIVGNN